MPKITFMPIRHVNLKVYGRVQGVFFRTLAKDLADSLGITGSARNNPDGTVYIETEGEEELLKKLVTWCHRGPTLAQVDKVEITEGPLQNFTTFTIL